RAVALALESDLVDLLVAARRGSDDPDAPLPRFTFPDCFVPSATTFPRTDGCPHLDGAEGLDQLIPAIPRRAAGDERSQVDVARVERPLEIGHRKLAGAGFDGPVDEMSE